MGLVWWEPCLWGFAFLRVYEICSFGRQFWASFGGSRVYGDLQLWSAVMGLVWWEPCLWGFAALVGSDGPRLVGGVSMGICSFDRQFWASFGGSRVYGDLQLWRQFWASFGGSRVYGFLSFGRQ